MMKDTANMNNQDLGFDGLNSETTENLFSCFSKVYSSNNLLIMDRRLSSLINYLCPFSKLKSHGKFEKLLWLEDIKEEDLGHLMDQFDGLILLIDNEDGNLKHLEKFKRISKRIYIVVKDLKKAFTYQLHSLVGRIADFNSILNGESYKVSTLSKNIKLYGWTTNPIYVDGILTLCEESGGITSYFCQPIKHINSSMDAVVRLMEKSNIFLGSNRMLKFKNMYAKGDHAQLMVDMLRNEQIPDYLSRSFSSSEVEFYNSKLRGNADLVVLERNLDMGSVAMSQLNYQGLIDDLFQLDFQSSVVNKERQVLNDSLYDELKHLNFASVGPKLNKLAKLIQSEYKKKDDLDDLDKIHKLVNSLGDLTTKQELIKKHTAISEAILNRIKLGTDEETPSITSPYNELEAFLEFQNDLTELDYRSQILHLKRFLNESFNKQLIFSSLILVSLFNDGIKEKDFDWILEESYDNYGTDFVLAINSMVEKKLVRINNESDFLRSFAGLKSTTTNDSNDINNSQNTDDVESLGINAFRDVNKNNFQLIDKFWNLHPLNDNEGKEDQIAEDLIDEYSSPSFALPSNTVPLLYRLVESLYFRDFLKYKPVNNTSRRPNWDNLGLSTMLRGNTADVNICDTSSDRSSTHPPAQEYVVVVILGGTTRAEISCFHYLQQKFNKLNRHKQLVILTSGIANTRALSHLLHS